MKTNVLKTVKAIIRHNNQDGQQVVYYRQGGRFFKLLDGKRIRPMSVHSVSFANLRQGWSDRYTSVVVHEDEQVLFKGKPVNIKMDTFRVNEAQLV